MRQLVFLLLVLIWPTQSTAQNTGLWYFSYVEADSAGQISSCNANFDFTNAFLSARLAGEEFDFIYFRDDFTLPFDQFLGRVLFRIDRVAFVVGASTNARLSTSTLSSAQLVFLTPQTTDYADLFQAFKNGSRFAIEFPNGDTYEFPLTGSNRAFSQASQCWASRPTGPFSNNPFGPPTGVNNPFETL